MNSPEEISLALNEFDNSIDYLQIILDMVAQIDFKGSLE